MLNPYVGPYRLYPINGNGSIHLFFHYVPILVYLWLEGLFTTLLELKKGPRKQFQHS